MRLIALTPEKEIFNGNIKSIKVPGTSGQFEILEGHAAIVSALSEGTVRIIDEKGESTKIDIEKGFVEVLENEVSLLINKIQSK